MKDTTEFPEGTEQAKHTSHRLRTSARPKPESAASATTATPITGVNSVNADQHTRPATSNTPRANRRPPLSNGATHTQQGTEQGPSGSSTQSRPAQRQDYSPTQQGPSGSSTQSRPAQRQDYSPTQQGQRPTNVPRPTNAPQQGQRYGGQAGPSSRPAQSQRSGNAPTGPARQGNSYGQRPTQTGPATYPPTQQRPAPQGGSHGPASSRPTQDGRPASSHGGGTRSSHDNGSQGPARPANRPPTPAQRPERRGPAVKEKPTGPISLPLQIMVKDLAELLHATPNEVIKALIGHRIFANINQVIEYEKAAIVAKELGFEPTQAESTATVTAQSERQLSANEAMIAARDDDGTIVIPPVVTIMGHVDHGKTSLLDTIRKTKVAAGEAGGITQHIGAYQVEINGKKITFLDTPGHEAFTAMRARGAQATHIVIIVIAADDGVMPQTREAISHAQAAKVPIIIALNKIDKPSANPDRVKQQLAEMGILIEEYGGDVVCVPVSARKGTGIDDLLEYILLVAEVQDIRANPNRLATGIIIEAKLEKNAGPTATVLVQQGTLKMGDNIIVGAISGKVRAMFNDRGKRIQKAAPSTPVSIIGLPEVPQAGDRLEVVVDERTAKQRAQQEAEKRKSESTPLGQISLDTLYTQMQEGAVKELNIVLKCDVQGSAEALKSALAKISEENIKVRLIHEGIGNINETDVHLAAASGAVVIAFNVKADGAAQRQAQKEGVDIRYYNIIYKLTDDIQAALTGMLEPTYREVVEGHAEVVQIFKAGKNTVIAGCRVTDGKITRNSSVRIMRKASEHANGKIASIRRGKDDVREVSSGYECGIVIEDYTDYEVGDIIEAFAQERVTPGV